MGSEERFEHWRKMTGLMAAPVVFVAVVWMPVAGLRPEAHRLLAVLGAVVVLWVTEAIPLAVTALLGPLLCVLLGIAPAKEVFRGFADPIIFLFLGSFLIAEAMLRHGLNRRIAFGIMRQVGTSPTRLLAAFGVATGFVSLWVSNTATTAMMFPIALAILKERQVAPAFATALMLMTAFAASIGGLGTPVGTPPNLIGLGLIETSLKIKITFFQWMMFGFPLAAALIVFLCFHFRAAARAAVQPIEVQSSGPISPGERNVLIAFSLTVAMWIVPGIIALWRGANDPLFRWFNQHLPEAMAALLGGILLFLIPTNLRRGEFTLSWRDTANVDWGTILLFGGGLAMGDLMFSTGVAKWMGEGIAHSLHANTVLGLTMLFAAIATVVSETTSNVASAAMVVPVAIAVAQAAGVPPLQPALAACLASSLGFMLPVSTPPNAIVYGSGLVPVRQMIRHGLMLDVVGWAAVVMTVMWIVPRVMVGH
ncbi:MAG TPA: SLC13 family permease [Verrucomicrobiae bacterium]|nr:SLC13 family permease [Verrucomicrobiae bacterium]